MAGPEPLERSVGAASPGAATAIGFADLDDAPLDRTRIRWAAIASLGDYLDAGSIVAGGAALPLFTSYLHFGSTTVSLIAAFGSNGISTGIGAAIAGRLGDRFGRKFIYSWDLLLYALGAIVVAVSVSGPMLIAGYMIMGVAVGIDVPTSWSLIAEFSPRKHRGKLMAFTNIAWYIGPIVILLLAVAFHSLGLLGGRLLFVSLLVVSLVAYMLRRKLVESPRWLRQQEGSTDIVVGTDPGDTYPTDALTTATSVDGGQRSLTGSGPAPKERSGYRRLFGDPKLRKRLAFLMPIYFLWGLPAGTYGFFEPTLFKTVGAHSLLASDSLDILWFGSAIIAVVFVFMPLNDRIDRRILYAISAAFCAAGFFLLVWAPIDNIWVALGNILLFGFGQGIGLWPLQRIWSVELFPTELRNTAQGFLWAVMRILLGIWSYFLLDFTSAVGFDMVALAMALMFTYNFVVGGLLGPKTQSMSLESI